MIRLDPSDLEAAAVEAGHVASALGLEPQYLRCTAVVWDLEFGEIARCPVRVVDDDPEFAAFVAKIEGAFAEALREVEAATARLPGGSA